MNSRAWIDIANDDTQKIEVPVVNREEAVLPATIGINFFTGGAPVANAHLVAAAPDLLDALEWLVALLPDPDLDRDTIQRRHVMAARAAIAKAKGDTP